MSYTKQITIFCDQCGNWEQVGATSATQARRMLKRRSWLHRSNGQDVCPQCRAGNTEVKNANGRSE
jgi:hypothetical protein